MAHDELQTYMNDHLAGSVAAIEVLERLVRITEEPDEQQLFVQLRRDVEEDQTILQRLLEQVGGRASPVRQAAAWVTDKLSAVKLRVDDPSGRRLAYFEALETLALGILGKRALWRALGAAADRIPQLAATDFRRLEERALDQHDRVEASRIATARRIFPAGENAG